ncbi:unnamed protein product [Prunus armeniaca]
MVFFLWKLSALTSATLGYSPVENCPWACPGWWAPMLARDSGCALEGGNWASGHVARVWVKRWRTSPWSPNYNISLEDKVSSITFLKTTSNAYYP